MNRPAKLRPFFFACLAGAVLLSCGCKDAAAPPPPPGLMVDAVPAPGIILISLDTLRADRLGCYGCERRTSPFLDRLAARSVRFGSVYSQAPRTAPSHMTIFTGLYPSEHKVRFGYNVKTGAVQVFALAGGIQTVPQLLQQAGFRTAAFTSGGELAAEAGFDRGFEIYKEGGRQLTAKGLEPVKKWLAENGGRKFFLFLHTYQIHDPYLPPPPYNQRFDPDYQGWIKDSPEYLARTGNDYQSASSAFWRKEPNNNINPAQFSDADVRHLLALYDGNVAYVDDLLAEFFAWMESQPWFARTVVIITSDHGEEFMEHGYFLHRQLYTETLHVPLLIHFPHNQLGGVVDTGLAASIDLPRTILGIAGVPAPPGMHGQDLQGRMLGAAPAPDFIYSEEPWLYPRRHRAVRAPGWCLYLKSDEPKDLELYNRAVDPSEQTNVAASSPDEVDRLQQALAVFSPPPKPGPSHQQQVPGAPGLRANGRERPEIGRPVPDVNGQAVRDTGAHNLKPEGRNRKPPETDQPLPADPERVKKLRALGYIQ